MPELINLEKYNGIPIDLIIAEFQPISDEDRKIGGLDQVSALNPIYKNKGFPKDVAEYSIVDEFFNSSLGGCISSIKTNFRKSVEEEKINADELLYHTVLKASDMQWANDIYVSDNRRYCYKGEHFTDEWFTWLNEKLVKLQDRRKK